MTVAVNKEGMDWRIIKKWCEDHIADTHRNMENMLPPELYHLSRGQISILRQLIAFVEPDPTPTEAADDIQLYP